MQEPDERPWWLLWRHSKRCFEGTPGYIATQLHRRGYVAVRIDGTTARFERPHSGAIILLGNGIVFAAAQDRLWRSAVRVLNGLAHQAEPRAGTLGEVVA